jgi:hypothetical protein
LRKALLIAAVTLLYLRTASAQDCSGVTKKKDPFTQETVASASLKCGDISISLEKSADKYLVGFHFMMGSYSDAVIKKGKKSCYALLTMR